MLILQAMNGSTPVSLDGTFRMRCPMAFAPGTYELIYHPNPKLEHHMPGEGSLSGRLRNSYRELRQTIEIAHGMDAVVLRPQAK